MQRPFLAALLLAMVLGGTAPVATAQSASPADADPRFDILEFVVEGNTVLAAIDIERAVLPFLGEGKTIRDVESARKSLEDEYQRRGYQTVFVDIPEQRVNAGEVRLRVLEGRVERLRVTGTRYFALGEIRAGVPALAEGSVPDFNAVQAQLATLNRTADRQVQPVLRAGRTPGTVEVDLAVKDQLPLHGEIELNNRSSAFTSESRLSAGLHWDNLWQRQHSAGITLQASPQARDEVKVLVGNYLWRMADSQDALALYAVRSDSKVALVGSSVVLGDASIVGARWVRPLPGSANVFHTLTFGIDHKRFGQTNIATATEQADVLGALDYVPLSASYSATRTVAGASTSFTLGITAAPRGLLGNDDAEFQGRRALARAGWSVLRIDVQHERRLADGVSTWARVEGLWSGSALVSNEQFTLGGAESVRGYREAELAGDRGGRASVELRWWPWRRAAPAGASATPPASPWLADLQLYALLDAGALESDQPPGMPRTRRWIGGVGAGLRWAAFGWRTQLEAARALNPGGGGLQGAITDKGDWRMHLRLGYDF
jgi:hemolysin activation/secretion protein